jgi:hypothetical protein
LAQAANSQLFTDDYRELLAALLGAGARFLIVGAHALGVHGVPRATGDLDVWIEPTPDNARRVWHALAAFGAPLGVLGISEADFTTPDIVAQLGLPPNRIDILTGVSGLTFGEAWDDRLELTIDHLQLPFLGRASLIRNKRASARKKDLGDIESLGESE